MSDELNDPHHERETAIMVNRALREGWEIPEQTWAMIPRLVAKGLIDSKSDRVKQGWIKLLIQMDKNNIQRDAASRTPEQNHLHLHGSTSVQDVVQQLLREEHGGSGDASGEGAEVPAHVRSSGIGRKVGGGAASRSDQQDDC